MPVIKATGLILKQTEYGETNRMLSIFTKEYGIINAAVYGAKSIKGGKGAASQVFCYSQFELSKSKGEIYTVLGVTLKESFFPISEDIQKLSLAAYLCDITYYAVGRDNPEEKALTLLLNTLYAIAYNDTHLKKAKCVYEMRLMCLLGYKPTLTKCVKCGNIKNIVSFSAKSGGLICSDCPNEGIPVGKSLAEALKFIISVEDKKMFSFTVSDSIMETLERVCEDYVRMQLDMEFASLLYFKNMMV